MTKHVIRKVAVGNLLLAVVFGLAFAARTAAQLLYGSMVGNVTDVTGGAVPGATVKATNKDTAQSRTATTGQSGEYTFSTLPQGTYSVEVTKPSFRPFTNQNVPITVNNVARLNVTLAVGQVTEAITVTGEVPLLQADRSDVRADVSTTELANLPNPVGRNFQQVLRTVPGFSPPSSSHSIPTNPSRALEHFVGGVSDRLNNTRIDGASSTNVWVPENIAYVPSIEAIDTVNVVTGSFDAEQTGAGGAAINVSMKSGTNQFHGSAFEEHTDNRLKAKAWVLTPSERKPKLVINEFGSTIGGPIKKDKAFFFASYEGNLDHEFASTQATVPTAAMRAGDLAASPVPIYDPRTGDSQGKGRTPFPDNKIPSNRIDPIALKIQSFVPLPTRTGLTNDWLGGAGFFFNRHRADTKLNWNPTEKLATYLRFGMLHYDMFDPQLFSPGNGPRASSFGGNDGTATGNTFSTTAAATYTISPSFIMDANFGWTRSDTQVEQEMLNQKVGLDILGIPGTNGPRPFEGGWPQFRINGFATLGTGTQFQPYFRSDPQFQYADNFTWTRSVHEVRWGVNVYVQDLNQTQPEFTGSTGAASGGFEFQTGPTALNAPGAKTNTQFNSYASFLLGLPSQIGKIDEVVDEFTTRGIQYALYVRDRWNVTPKLTLNVGARWEYFPVPKRRDTGLENFNAATNQIVLCGRAGVPQDCGIRESKNKWAPSVGVAYRATPTFVIRAGFGLANNPFPLFKTLRTNYPLVIVENVPAANSFVPAGMLAGGIPAITVPSLNSPFLTVPGDIATASVEQKINRGYIESWNFFLQKQLPFNFSAQAGYVGTRSIGQNAILDLNAGQVIGAGTAGEPLVAPFGRTATTRLTTPVGHSQYDALQATLARRFSGGVQLNVSYTYSKTIGLAENDDSSLPVSDLAFFDRNRRVLNFDRTHNINISNVWQLPFGVGRKWANGGGIVSAVAGGWQVNNLVSIYSGLPFSVTSPGNSLNLPGSSQTADQIKPNVDISGRAGRGVAYFDTSAFAQVTEPRFGNTDFNILRGPWLYNWDFGVFRQFNLSERYKLQFRAESFNFTNTPHHGTPSNSVTASDFGQITSTLDIGRDGFDEREFRLSLHLSW